MKIKRKMIVEQDIRYLRATMGVRYWDDCDYSEDNGQTWNQGFKDNDEDSEYIKKLTPCVVRKDIGYGESDYLELIIDLEEGKVLNWKNGFCLKTSYKVCDDAEYVFLDENMNEVVNITKEYNQYYVPAFLSGECSRNDDYLNINIYGTGHIEHFEEMKYEIENYFDDLNDED